MRRGYFGTSKVVIDAQRQRLGQYLLTGSQKFTLMREVADSLAGRCAWVELETLSAGELLRGGVTLEPGSSELQLMLRGFFPALWQDTGIEPADFYRSYLATYIERDVRQLLNVTNLRDFERFLRLCATYSGQSLNMTEIARGVGVAGKTIKGWLSVLEVSNQMTLLEPYFGNVGKRIVKTPKLYFNDTGLACFLLGLDARSLASSSFCGALWETFIFSELHKITQQVAPQSSTYFYRDQQGREVDFVLLFGHEATLLECKLTESPGLRDARRVEEVAGLFAGAKPVPLTCGKRYVVARPAHRFGLSANTEAIHGYELESLWAG